MMQMITQDEAHKKLIANGFQLLLQSPYPFPIIMNARFDVVAEFLHGIGYHGEFACINDKTAKK